MNERLQSFYDSLKGKRVLFLGIGRSNTPLAICFARKGAIVAACDRRSREELGDEAGRLEAAGVALRLGDGYLDDLDADMVFRTPGMRYTLPQLDEARRRGVAVTSEMELFFDLCPCRIIGVTGSDGKTTTTTLIAEMLRRADRIVHLGGNIGCPLFPEIESIAPSDVAVVELSSFQLISMRRGPDTAVVTNVTPNHLDIHKDMAEYIGAKRNVFLHQNAFSRTVLNADNGITASFVPDVRGQCLLFSRRRAVSPGSFLNAHGVLCVDDGRNVHEIVRADEIRIPGLHNVENMLAAVAAVWGMVPPEAMAAVAREFPGVEHRIEFVRELAGVRYYNDSIATSPTRTIAGLDSFRQKVVLIAGGYDKHIPFDVLGPKVVEKVKVLILTGKTADKIEAAVRGSEGFDGSELPIYRAKDLPEAVAIARRCAAAGDVVTLSPACASFDSYKDFEARGNAFKAMVAALQ